MLPILLLDCSLLFRQVGRADHACFQPPQPGHRPEINDPYVAQFVPWPTGPKHTHMTDAAEVQLQGLIDVLQKEGVEVVRPVEVDWTKPISAPNWSSPNQYCGVCPRDTMITMGNVIMEVYMLMLVLILLLLLLRAPCLSFHPSYPPIALP